jgi:transposase-like protein
LRTACANRSKSWLELLRDLKERGLKLAPNLAVGDGALGFWAALEETEESTQQSRRLISSRTPDLTISRTDRAAGQSDLSIVLVSSASIGGTARAYP